MNREKQNFENYPELSKHIERMAITGRTGTGSEWCAFLHRLNETLAIKSGADVDKVKLLDSKIRLI